MLDCFFRTFNVRLVKIVVFNFRDIFINLELYY